MQEYKKILIPTDGSPFTSKAIEKGISLAKLVGGEVTALYVIDERSFHLVPKDHMISSMMSMLEQEAQEALDIVKMQAEESGVPVKTITKEGNPTQIIPELGKEHDLIIMATHGRSGLDKVLLGSIAESVIHHAPCPVLLIKVDPSQG